MFIETNILFFIFCLFINIHLNLGSTFRFTAGWDSMLDRKYEREVNYESTINRVLGVRSAEGWDSTVKNRTKNNIDHDSRNSSSSSNNNNRDRRDKSNSIDSYNDNHERSNSSNSGSNKDTRSKDRKVYLYSSQSLSFKVLAMNEMRDRLGKVKGTYVHF